MSDQGERPTPKRGEAAWKEEKERIARRNAEARKAGKQRQEAHARHTEENRRKAERLRRAALGKPG